MITKAQVKILSDLWSSYQHGEPGCCTDCMRLLTLTTAETRSHDKWRAAYLRRGMTKIQEARYFALKRIAEFTIGNEPIPPLANYWHWQQSVYGAYALTVDSATAPAIRQWSSENEAKLRELLTWDYAEMVAHE